MTEQKELDSVSIIQQMAELNLTGQGFSDYQKAKALDIAFEAVRNATRNSKKADILAGGAQKIFTFLDNDAKKRNYRVGEKTVKKVEEFVNLFWKMCENEYNGSLRTMYKYRFSIRSMYLWYISQVIRQKIEDKKKAKSD